MAIITDLNCNLREAVKVRYLDGNLFSQDVYGNIIRVTVMDGDEEAVLAGTVSGIAVRADGGSVAITDSSVDGNVATVVLPAAAYLIPGPISIVIKISDESTVTTIAAVVANVYQSSTDTPIDPGTIIPSITTLIQQIETAVASIPADYSSLWHSLAPVFSTGTSYTVGQYVTYDGGLYRFKNAHSGSWASADVDAVDLGSGITKNANDISDLKSALNVFEEGYENTTEKVIGNKMLAFKTGRYKTPTGTNPAAGVLVSFDENANYVCTISPCSAGDIFTADVYGSSGTIRAWFFLTSEMKIVSSTSYAGTNVHLQGTITAPENASYVVMNNNLSSMASGYYAYKGMSNIERLENTENDISEIVETYSNAFPLVENPVYKASYWRTGYYVETTGEYETWTRSICTGAYFTADEDDIALFVKTDGTCNIAVCEYLADGTFVKTHGAFKRIGDINPTSAVFVKMETGKRYTLSVGLFPSNTAESKLTDDFIRTITISVISATRNKYAVVWNRTARWRTGTINATTGEYETWDKAIVTRVPLIFLNDGILHCKAMLDKKIAIYEYTPSGYVGMYGSTVSGLNEEYIPVKKGNLYHIVIGRFPDGDASDYINDTYMKTVIMECRSMLCNRTIESTGDNTDRTEEIRSALVTFGEAHLGAGDFYVSNLMMPNGTTLTGCGNSTRIIMLPGDGYCIDATIRCTLKDFALVGSETDLQYIDTNETPTEGTRVGVKYSSSGDRGSMSNLYISNFDKAGIYCYWSGTAVTAGKNIDNCYINNCYVGLDLNKHAEFYRISNVSASQCHIGCRNNGGNNTIANCSFSSNNYGIYMFGDTNDSHGQFVGCILQHDRLSAIYLDSIDAGEIFSACNIDPNDETGYAIQAISAHRVIFTGCNFMSYSAISITGGGFIMFNGCNMRTYTASHYTSNNNNVKFVNCYDDSGNLIDPTA